MSLLSREIGWRSWSNDDEDVDEICNVRNSNTDGCNGVQSKLFCPFLNFCL